MPLSIKHKERVLTTESTATEWVESTFDRTAINTIKTLAIDAVQQANSGHPGLPMGAADFAYVLWTRFLKHDPTQPDWPDRDRFVLSAGHGCMLLYALLHLSGYALTLDDLKRFRQWGSRTPGHPEAGVTPGVEATTGPLGQGLGNAVGMALAERMLAARYNDGDDGLVDHFTYALCSDGDLMEGVAAEAASLAGHLQLGKLIVFYDDNRITIEGDTQLTFTEDVGARFAAYGWSVERIDGHDVQAITHALDAARAATDRPSLIVGRTHIAHGSPNKQDTAASHGSPLGEEEVRLTKINLGWPESPPFHVPAGVAEFFAARRRDWVAARQEWEDRRQSVKARRPELVDSFERALEGTLEPSWDLDLPAFAAGESMATRKASGVVLAHLAAKQPTLVGGSADLAPSNNTFLKDYEAIGPNRFGGRNLHFGVREHGMGAVQNGVALHRGLRVYTATFLTFSDYMRPAIRLAALTHLPTIYVFTHDSIFLGEDGPTHQPVEHLASLRAIPNLVVLRPADAAETVQAWRVALAHRAGPVALVLTRQSLPVLEHTGAGVERGGYAIAENADPELILLASGSEVHLASSAAGILEAEGRRVRVVSMPSWELFESQPDAYRHSVLPPSVTARLAIEAGVPQGWERYVTDRGRVLGIERFGASAPASQLAEQFGFTVERVVQEARSLG